MNKQASVFSNFQLFLHVSVHEEGVEQGRMGNGTQSAPPPNRMPGSAPVRLMLSFEPPVKIHYEI